VIPSIAPALILSPAVGPKIITGENHSLALKADGTLWVWGDDKKIDLMFLGLHKE
jgi:alpha-tubulin suppressor-like RCC1 family protein